MRRVGLFGGMFDPPHLGHVAAARAALAQLDVDLLVVTVAKDPQHRGAPVAPGELRLAMAQAAFGELEGCCVSDLELRREGPTYTIDTVEALARAEPEARLVLVVGADAAAGLPGWHRAEELAGLVEVAVVPRAGVASGLVGGFTGRILEMAPVDVSSTGVREQLLAGADPAGLVPAGVVPLVVASRQYSP